MAELFEKTPQNITMHIGNAYKEGELEKESTCKEYIQVQQEGKRKVSRMVKYYDLDVIISVGYHVKSKRGTAFRIWARQSLLSNDETNALFEVVTDYTYALDTLDNYDYERLTINKTTTEEPFHATYENAMEAINGDFFQYLPNFFGNFLLN